MLYICEAKDKIIEVDVVESNSQTQNCRSYFDCLNHVCIYSGRILNNWCPVCFDLAWLSCLLSTSVSLVYLVLYEEKAFYYVLFFTF